MEHVDKIARGEPPQSPDRMVRVRVAADIPDGELTSMGLGNA
jgi:peptidylprolyl isomerase